MRKIIQITSATVVGDDIYFGNTISVHALCNDGSVWEYVWSVNDGSRHWDRLPDIPQEDED